MHDIYHIIYCTFILLLYYNTKSRIKDTNRLCIGYILVEEKLVISIYSNTCPPPMGSGLEMFLSALDEITSD